MTLVIAMGNDIQHLEQTLDPLFNSYNIKPERVEVLVSRETYDAFDSRSLEHGNLLRVDKGDIVSDLKGRGIPERDAMFYAQGLRQGKDLILVDVERDVSERVASYFKHNRLIETAAPTSAESTAAPVAQTNAGEDESFKVIEEELKVGARTVERGGVKVEKTVETIPVEEEVLLKAEHAVVHRNPVNREATRAELEGAFSEETFEIREFAQEAVVKKEARVVEEVTLGKYTEERVETISDQVKRVDVNIESMDARLNDVSYDTLRPIYMKYHTDSWPDGDAFDRYEHAYQFGHAYALNARTRSMSYSDLEPHMRKDWDDRYEQSAWEDFKDQVSYAWHAVKSKFN